MTGGALVVGCGGTIGMAWIVAALAALAEQLDWDPRSAEVLQGTSAGAELIMMLGSGVSVDELVDMQLGTASDPPLRRHIDDGPSALPRLPWPRPLNPRLLSSQSGLTAVTGMAPTGRGDASWLQQLADSMCPDQGWLDHPPARLVAFDYRCGRRVAFGAPSAPSASPGEALRASWAIPGWLPPVWIAGRSYVGGGVASTASLDLLDQEECDEIFVIAPMASAAGHRVPGLGGIVEERLLRRPMSWRLAREAAIFRATGTRVTVITPRREDLVGLGANFMNRGHRQAAFASAMRTAAGTVNRALKTGRVPQLIHRKGLAPMCIEVSLLGATSTFAFSAWIPRARSRSRQRRHT
jgi:NTE family protein